jgi:hypothetical protein
MLRLVMLALARRKSRVAIAFAAIVLGVAIVSSLAGNSYCAPGGQLGMTRMPRLGSSSGLVSLMLTG